jgi:hypothetical protein
MYIFVVLKTLCFLCRRYCGAECLLFVRRLEEEAVAGKWNVRSGMDTPLRLDSFHLIVAALDQVPSPVRVWRSLQRSTRAGLP